jgi:type 2 lantibiotic biosynthesis protein LanM
LSHANEAVGTNFIVRSASPVLGLGENWSHLLEAIGTRQAPIPAHLVRPPDAEQLGKVPPWIEKSLRLTGAKVARATGTHAVVQPWLRDARRQLLLTVRAMNSRLMAPRVSAEVATSLAQKLEDDLLELAIRPVLLEAEIAERTGGTAQAYRDYLLALSAPGTRRGLVALYPGLALALEETCARWVAASSEFLMRFVADFADLRTHFGLPDDACLRSARYADSDPHEGGRRVAIAYLGQGLRLVYKPRPLRAFALYQSALCWLNNQGFSPELRPQMVLDRGLWGWVEFVSPMSCDQRNKVQQFYRRLGGQLALLRLIGATDCHHENIVAAGEHPQLVDIETLFRPLLAARARGGADAAAIVQTANSVLSTGLLPNPCDVNHRVADLSAVGALSYQETPLEAFQIQEDSSGRARVTHDLYRMGRAFNRPRLNGREVDPRSFVQEIQNGFQEAYHHLSRAHDELVSPGGLLDNFKDAEMRVLLRPTAAYASLLRESRHPTALYDGAERDRILAHLWRDVRSGSWPNGATKSEFLQLRQGDIPFFRAIPDRPDVHADRHASPVLVNIDQVDEYSRLNWWRPQSFPCRRSPCI